MNSDSPTLPAIVQPFRFADQPYEYKVTPLRECPTPADLMECDTPEKAAAYWRTHVPTHPYFNPECECLVVLMLNTRKRVKGHYLVSIGTMDTILVHPREVFRLAIMTASAGRHTASAHDHTQYAERSGRSASHCRARSSRHALCSQSHTGCRYRAGDRLPCIHSR